MIRVVRINGDCVPQACCDVCLGPVKTVDLAMLVWFEDLDQDGESTALYLVHKGPCDEKLQRSCGTKGAWHEIDYGMRLLMETVRMHHHVPGEGPFRPVVFEAAPGTHRGRK